MSNEINLDYAFNLGCEFAKQLNNSPAEAQNWSALGTNDDLPVFDYIDLKNYYGEVNKDIEESYHNGFNSVFKPIEA